MRIGTIDSEQPAGWFGRNARNAKAQNENSQNADVEKIDVEDVNAPNASASNANAPEILSSDMKSPNPDGSLPNNSATPNPPSPPRMATPGSGVPGGGTPGSGAASGVRTVMWKGKALNMDTTRNALTEAAAAEATLAASQNTAIEAVAASQALHEHVSTILTGMDEMCGGLQEIYGVLTKISERDTAGERVFNTLHAELSDYKKDFIYEHLKPVVRPLLFLYDSLEQFEGEIERFDPQGAQPVATEKSGVMPTRVVRQNTIYFREQLVEALRICEVTPMDDPNGTFNPRFHRAVKVIPVTAEQDGTVQGVVRSGWFLNGQLLRPAEVIVGKKQ